MDEHHLAPHDWLDVIEKQYLKTYLRAGGAAVKIAVTGSAEVQALTGSLRDIALRNDFQFAQIDAASRKVHLVQNLFTGIAQQIDWDGLARAFMISVLEPNYKIQDGDLSVEALAEANDEARELVLKDLRRVISNRVFRNYDLSREFRVGATAMCRATFDASADVQRENADVQEWLAGTLERVAALRRLAIFRKVQRTNARQLLFSTSEWIRICGAAGLVTVVDISRYALGRSAEPDGNRYTKMASLDMHEVLREFVDATDDLHSALVVFVTGEEFLTNEDFGLRNYDALRLRLTDDVRDRHRANPFAPMVRLRGAA